MKKKFLFLSLLISMLLFAGCGGYNYDNLFPDAASKMSSTSGTSFELYTFSVRDGYGEMKVFLDTSEGHTFVKEDDSAMFEVNDKSGNSVLKAMVIDREHYQQYTAECKDVKKINGRDFFYIDSTQECFSYMADCGLDAGLYMTALSGDESVLDLVAFRGVALTDSSSDIYAYQGKAEDIAAKVAEDTEEVVDSLSAEEEKEDEDIGDTLAMLDTDYNKVVWGESISPIEDKQYFVVNSTSFEENDKNYLCVSMTNLYDEPLEFSGLAQAYDADDKVIGDVIINEPCIGPGNTVVTYIECIGKPQETVHFEKCELTDSAEQYAPWEADYSLSGNKDSDEGNLNLEFYSANDEDMILDSIDILYLDDAGQIINKTNYKLNEEMIKAGETYETVLPVDIGIESLLNTKNIAIFSNPKKVI